MALEPTVADEKTVYHAGSVFFTAGFLGRLDDLVRYDGRIGLCNPCFLKLTWHDLLDLVFEAQSNFGDFDGGKCGLDSFAIRDR